MVACMPNLLRHLKIKKKLVWLRLRSHYSKVSIWNRGDPPCVVMFTCFEQLVFTFYVIKAY